MLSLDNVEVAFQGEALFSGVSFRLGDRERVGLVGRNGSGKSTLLCVIDGSLEPTTGCVTHDANFRIGHLAQHLTRADTQSVLEEAETAFSELATMETKINQLTAQLANPGNLNEQALERAAHELADLTERYHMLGGEQRQAKAERALTGLGFEREQFSMPTATLSGGWRMRIELAKILLRNPDLLLLDEPTNHLDIESIQWLENYIQSYQGALVLISHDRRFLDNCTTRTLELSLGKMHDFNAPYSQYVEIKKEQHAQQVAAWKNQQRMIEKTEAFIERFRYKPEKSNQVQSRIKQLKKLDLIEVEAEDHAQLSIRFPDAPRAGDVVVSTEDLGHAFGPHRIFAHANIAIARGEKVAFVGRNGEGKTTLARIITGELHPTEGKLHLGHNVELGYFAQNQETVLDPELTVFETIDKVATGDMRRKIRDLLGAFLFRGEEIDKKVRVLSGGERNRLAMVKLMLHPYNLLLLDEPTNHLDIQAKDILKQALMRYNGALILVSHDRDFLNGLVSKVYEFAHGKVKEHLGGIDAFLQTRRLENLQQLEGRESNQKPSTSKPNDPKTTPASSKADWKHKKALDNQLQRKQREVAEIESKIELTEKKQKDLELQMATPDQHTDSSTIYTDYQNTRKELARLMKRWEETQYELDILERGGGESNG